VGVQDLCFPGNDSKFWVRFYYPISKEAKEGPPQRGKKLLKYATSIAYVVVQLSILWSITEHNHVIVQIGSMQHTIDIHKILPTILITIHVVHLLFDVLSALPESVYAPEGKEVFDSFADFGKMPRFLFSHMSAITVSCVEDAPLCPAAVKRTVLYCHGLGGTRFMYSRTCIELASQGYFVMCPEFGDSTASLSILPDGTKRKYEEFDGDATSTEYRDYRHKQLEHRMSELSTLFSYIRHVVDLGIDDVSRNQEFSHPHVRWQTADNPTTTGASAEEHRSRFVSSLTGSKLFQAGGPVLLGHSFGGSTVSYVLLKGGIPVRTHAPSEKGSSTLSNRDSDNHDNDSRSAKSPMTTRSMARVTHVHTATTTGFDESSIQGWSIMRPAGVVMLDPWFFPVSKLLDEYPRIDKESKTEERERANPVSGEAGETAASDGDDGRAREGAKLKHNIEKLKYPSEIEAIPVLVFHAQLFQWPENLKRENLVVRSFPRHLQVHIRDAGHYIFSDIGLLSPIVMALMKKGGRYTDPYTLQGRLNVVISAFVDSVSSKKSMKFSSCLRIIEHDESLQLLSSHDE
jgi:hypothetical protein